MKDRNIAAILAFVVGGMGAHRFYLGQPGLGMLYLAFCWTPIPWVLAFFEFVSLALMEQDAFHRRFNGMFLLSEAGVGYSPMLPDPFQAVHAGPRAIRPVQTWEPPPVATTRAIRPRLGAPEPALDPEPMLRDLDRRRDLGEFDDYAYAQEKRRIIDTYSL